MLHGLVGSLKDQACRVESQGKRVADDHGFSRVGQAKRGRAFDLPAGLGGVAALGVGLPAHAQLPDIRAYLDVARQADGAVWQGQPGGHGKTERVVGGGKRAGIARNNIWSSGNVGVWLVDTFKAADPFGRAALVVVPVGGKPVAEGAERVSAAVIAALEAGKRVGILIRMADTNGAQGMQVSMGVFQDFVETFTRITQQFANFEIGETFLQVLQTGDGEQVVIAVGRCAGAGERPDQKEAVIHDVEGFGFAAEMVFSTRDGLVFAILGRIGVGAGLVTPGIIDISRLRVAPGSKTAVLPAGLRVTMAAFPASLMRRTGTLSRRLGTGWNLVRAHHA